MISRPMPRISPAKAVTAMAIGTQANHAQSSWNQLSAPTRFHGLSGLVSRATV